MKQGIAYCGGKLEDYLEVVHIYYATGLDKKKDIQNFYEQKDWKNYAILVHAVKSTSQGIGAAELSDMAKELERAGKSADENYIQNHHQEMMEEYARVLEELGKDERINPDIKNPASEKAAEGDSENAAAQSAEEESKAEDLREMTREELEGILGEIQEALGTFESEAVDEILKKLQGCRYGEHPLAELVEPISKKAAMFDFMGAEDELAGIRERLG